MHWIIGIMVILAYMAIGAFIAGLADDEQVVGLYMILWPLLGIMYAFVKLSEIPVNLGLKVRKEWKKYKRNKEKML